ncbi:Transcription repressor like [Quillaja saponaria]|uniref:Transcription repressor n=1 Tax=Quillaja saponaria TaxID=32244 RepID=A0AAD7Q0Y9_QUISA|nr:Transcription repressor like [Quillaja saponaria]
MPSTLGIIRNLNLCFLKIRRPSMSSTTTSTPDEDNHNRPLPSTTTTTTGTTSSLILFKNFNSIYDNSFDYNSTSNSSSSLSTAEPEAADIAIAFASQRFFFSAPGRSNSIIESTNTDMSPINVNNNNKLFNDIVAVPTYSPDPYVDFRRSMQEIVEARDELMDVKSNWESLHELLLSYLAINPKSSHKFILSAFADLLVSLMWQQP